MPRSRSSGRKSSTDNKSDIQQAQNQTQQNQNQSKKQSPKQQAVQPPSRKLSEIQNQVQSIAEQPKQQQKQQEQSKQEVQTQAPNRYTVYRQSFNSKWSMKDFDINKIVQEFGKLDRYQELQDSDQQQPGNQQIKQKKKQNQPQIKLRVYKSSKQTTGLNKKTTYTITCRDKTGSFQITREKLLLRWPGCFIPPVPTKKFGNNPYELVLIRMKFLNSFLKCLCKVPELYNGIECQIFFKHEGDYINTNGKLIESQLQKLKAHQNTELLQKYKQVFANQVQDLTEQEQKIAITEIKQLQSELKSWKVDLTRFKDQVRSAIASKDKYYQAMTRLSTVLLPQFQSIILDWINDDKFNKPTSQLATQQNKQTNKQGYLLNTQQYGTALKDAALSVRNYNQSLWIVYDIFKFQLKQTDAILESIQSYQFLVRQMDYLNRNININKDQIQSLDQKKTTLKIFMMGGSVQQKKARLNKESQTFQERLAVVKQLLNFVLNVLINSIDNFHNDRAEGYKKMLAKSSCEQLVLVKKLMDFHMFELQTFKKKDLFGRKQKIEQDEQIVQQ